MWTKNNRFVFSVGIYNYLINPNIDIKTNINWHNIIENSIYNNPEENFEQNEETQLINSLESKFQNFLVKEESYLAKINSKLQRIKETPELVIGILVSFLIEMEEFEEQNLNLEENFPTIIKSYSRMTQDLIGTDYMMLVNSIIRK